ncbi:class I SAM-dependent methyltransferase [Azonexus sp.]|uniref:class I SAM-dependent methyltransferase n=1 Tax=Azonexus sp. TaxID=1872668 RepID=UPI0035B24ECF
MAELSGDAHRMSIPGLDAWLASAQGRYVLGWEQRELDAAVADVFGFNALQLGLPQCDFLRANRIPLRRKAGGTGPIDVACELTALPFASQSTDLIVLPHVLEFADDPHQILREVERVLIPEGQLIVVGFNPFSLWGLKRRRDAGFPWNGGYLPQVRVRDWLKLLGFEVDRGRHGCYAPPCEQPQRHWHWLENAGRRWWPFCGGIYILRAIKRTHAMRLIAPAWRRKPLRAKALRPIANKEGHGH